MCRAQPRETTQPSAPFDYLDATGVACMRLPLKKAWLASGPELHTTRRRKVASEKWLASKCSFRGDLHHRLAGGAPRNGWLAQGSSERRRPDLHTTNFRRRKVRCPEKWLASTRFFRRGVAPDLHTTCPGRARFGGASEKWLASTRFFGEASPPTAHHLPRPGQGVLRKMVG
jgi:hypothetical protein